MYQLNKPKIQRKILVIIHPLLLYLPIYGTPYYQMTPIKTFFNI